LGGTDTTENAGLTYKQDATLNYYNYTFTIVFEESNSLTPTQTYGVLPLFGAIAGDHAQYSLFHAGSGSRILSGVTRTVSQKRVMTVAVSSTYFDAWTNRGSYSLKVDDNATTTSNNATLFRSAQQFMLGSSENGTASFRGKVFDVQIQDTRLSDADVSTLHTTLRSKYGF